MRNAGPTHAIAARTAASLRGVLAVALAVAWSGEARAQALADSASGSRADSVGPLGWLLEGGLDPLGPNVDVGVGFSPALLRGRLEMEGRVDPTGSPHLLYGRARFSQLDVVHFYGLGNATDPAGDRPHHRVDHAIAGLEVGAGLSVERRIRLSVGVVLERSSTSASPDRFFTTIRPVYGDGTFVQGGVVGRLDLDPFRNSAKTSHRARVELRSVVYPAVLDTESATGTLSAEASALLEPMAVPRLSTTLRGAVYHAWGRFPWFRAAFVGGSNNLRGWHRQRFGGQTSLSAGVELRVEIAHWPFVVPATVGLFGFTDAGKVLLDGASPEGWHLGFGGGVWGRPLGQRLVMQGGVGVGREASKLYVQIGVPY